MAGWVAEKGWRQGGPLKQIGGIRESRRKARIKGDMEKIWHAIGRQRGDGLEKKFYFLRRVSERPGK